MRTPLLCPRCRYDVHALLAEAIETCPECGGPISREACAFYARTWRREGFGAVWKLFAVAAIVSFLTLALGWGAYTLGKATDAEWLVVIGVLVGYTGATIALLGLPTAPIGLVGTVHARPGPLLSMLLYAWLVLIGGAGLLAGSVCGWLIGLVLGAVVR